MAFVRRNLSCSRVPALESGRKDILWLKLNLKPFPNTTNPIQSFADDSTLHAGIMSNRPIFVVELECRRLATAASLSNDPEAITALGLENVVEFNASKTQYCTLLNKRCPSEHSVLMNNQAVPRSHSFKLLGVSITENMIRHEQVSSIVKAAGKRLGHLFTARSVDEASCKKRHTIGAADFTTYGRKQNIRCHLNSLIDAVDKLNDMGVEINVDHLAVVLLYSLPASFENFRCAIDSRDELPTPKEKMTGETFRYKYHKCRKTGHKAAACRNKGKKSLKLNKNLNREGYARKTQNKEGLENVQDNPRKFNSLFKPKSRCKKQSLDETLTSGTMPWRMK
nr:unnamed protein product [Callosobruchus chinensis]